MVCRGLVLESCIYLLYSKANCCRQGVHVSLEEKVLPEKNPTVNMEDEGTAAGCR